ncbi:MAG: nucleoside-diphosphate kinase [Elusimicrobia bacterium]|nr:MAG: nucleoside-diphosphate kinase [Elusimicrobiota bacterium]KAF0158161.1 MAG: nucleoside-diphosphate kinase [Elusimicrobiota bacterium]
MAIERTLVLIKPDGMQRHLAGLAIDRLENTHMELVGARIATVTDKLAREHYALLEGKGPFADKKFFEHLINFIKGEYHGDPKHRVLALVYQGENAVQAIRAAVGATNPEDASPDTIRGAFGRVCRRHGYYENVVHASGNVEEANREIAIWFRSEEMIP